MFSVSIELAECAKLAMWLGADTQLKVLDVRGNGLNQLQAASLFGHLGDALVVEADVAPRELEAFANEDEEDEDGKGETEPGDEEERRSEAGEESKGEVAVKTPEVRQATLPTPEPLFVVVDAGIDIGEPRPGVGHHEQPLRKPEDFTPSENGAVRVTRGLIHAA